MQAVTQIGSHNARLAHIRKFVMVPPQRGHTLRLVTIEEPPCVIGEWTREQCVDNGATALDVDSTLREHAQTMQTETTANLVWQDEAHQLVVHKRLKCAYEAENLDPSAAATMEALGINGTAAGNLQHAQTINERVLRLLLTSLHTSHQSNVSQNATLLASLQASWSENRKIQAELDAARAKQRAEIDLYVDALRDAEGGEPVDPEKQARAEVLAEMGAEISKVLPHVLVHLVQRFAQPQPANTNAQLQPPQQPHVARATTRARRSTTTTTVVDAETEPEAG